MAVGLQEPAPIRTLEQLKAEAIARADRNAYPLIGLEPSVVRQVLETLTSLDRDEWANAWSAIGDRAIADGRFEEGWRWYSFARWPVPLSPAKERAYTKALDAYRDHAKALDPPLEVVRLPFEGSEIVGYLRLPPASGMLAPVVLAIGGLDSRKEDLTERFAPLLSAGVGSFTLDMPGTGEAPIKIVAGAERMFSRAIDYLCARPRVDASRIAVYGGSFGGYWAAKLAVLERERIRGVVAQSPPVDRFFSSEFARTAFTNEEYLFDLGPAMMSLYDGVASVDDFLRVSPQHSLVVQGFIGKPTARMLVIAGVLDTQVPLADIDLLLHTGETPKEAWINPTGGHMGRQAHGWRDPMIFAHVTTPWLLRCLA
jgi:pimeloyl-ACP methyl ester carboxylesterase